MKDWKALYERAWEIASRAHQGQKDKGGHPYIGHPMAVADMVLKPEEKVVALLHDVVEDTFVTLQELEKEFPEEVVKAVDLLTKKKGADFSMEKYLKDIRHDVVEDTFVTLQELEKEFPEEVVKAVDLLTKKKGADFSMEKYLKDIRENEIARQVKLADLKHNMDLSRITNPTRKDLIRLERYKKSKDYLEGKKKER